MHAWIQYQYLVCRLHSDLLSNPRMFPTGDKHLGLACCPCAVQPLFQCRATRRELDCVYVCAHVCVRAHTSPDHQAWLCCSGQELCLCGRLHPCWGSGLHPPLSSSWSSYFPPHFLLYMYFRLCFSTGLDFNSAQNLSKSFTI